MFCREHPSFILKLGVVNLWEWVYQHECPYAVGTSDGGGFPLWNRVSRIPVKSMGDLMVVVYSLKHFMSPLVVVWILENKQSSREGIQVDLRDGHCVLCKCSLPLQISKCSDGLCNYTFNFSFNKSEKHINAALGKTVNTLINTKVIWSNSREIKECLENNNTSSNLEKCKLEKNNLKLKYAAGINCFEEI